MNTKLPTDPTMTTDEVVEWILDKFTGCQSAIDHTKQWLAAYDLPEFTELKDLEWRIKSLKVGLELHIRANHVPESD